ncbi:Altronate dehydratase [Planctomycetes bacterium CA13]|uniref:Altronate dehydratase n=1 Tax=Novipirellula herctigrandis TaxID=2527986 RepID=A0A5C5Z8R8_9BACT|nr:Altronate dehydratase [Planctomycetes bacterium CA13]
MKTSNNRAFVINVADNVATALSDLRPGECVLVGDAVHESAQVRGDIRSGHKFALVDLKVGDAIIKYGVAIGYASVAIECGIWVHLHNVQSQFDERSGTLDGETGAPTEGNVYV